MFRKKLNLSWQAGLLFLFVWLIGASFLLEFWPFIRSEGEWEPIAHTQYGFAVDYPAKWVAKKFGELGSRGLVEEKLQIYPSLLGDTFIHFYYRTSTDSTLNEVANWGDRRLNRFRDDEDFEEYPIEEDQLRGHLIWRKRYRTEKIIFEDVYIARSTDQIIITLQSSPSNFDNDYDEFEAIVSSFRPLD